MWNLDDVPEDSDASLLEAIHARERSKLRVALWPSTVARMIASKNTPPLVRAIVAHDASALAAHLDEASRRSAVGPADDPMTPLHYAVLADDAAAVDALLAAGADPNERTGADEVALILEAIAHASHRVLGALLPICDVAVTGPARRDLPVQYRDLPPQLWALYRLERGDLLDVLDDLAARGVDCTTRHPAGSLLHAGARAGRIDLVRWCIDRGMPPDSRHAPNLQTPLHEAASSRHADVVEELLRRGADVHGTCLRSRVSALHAVVSASGHEPNAAAVARTVDVLVGHGLAIDVRDARGRTPLHEACFYVDAASAAVLLERGASPDARDAQGRTPAELVPDTPLARRVALRELLDSIAKSSQKIGAS